MSKLDDLINFTLPTREEISAMPIEQVRAELAEEGIDTTAAAGEMRRRMAEIRAAEQAPKIGVGDTVIYYLAKYAPGGNTLEQYTGIVHDIHMDHGAELFGVKDGGFYISCRADDLTLVRKAAA